MTSITSRRGIQEIEERLINALAQVTNRDRPLLLGVDVVALESFKRQAQLGGERFLARIYTADELHFCRERWPQLAVRFAAKEACSKALGTGIRGISWREIEVASAATGKPSLVLSGRAHEVASEFRVESWNLSLTHTDEMAAAIVVGVIGVRIDEYR